MLLGLFASRKTELLVWRGELRVEIVWMKQERSDKANLTELTAEP